jgi:hypothetical protein
MLSVILFVYNHLDKWRDNSRLPNGKTEPKLNPDLPKFLTTYAHAEEVPVNFYPEEPQEGRHSVDIAAAFDELERYNEIITVFECKRLSELGKNRTDEYVTGHKEITGGIQRFKIEVHGKKHNIVGMIGYVQSETCFYHLQAINTCIDNLGGKPDENGLMWTDKERLFKIECDGKTRKYYCKSIHPRKTISEITIHHLWVEMD